MKHHSLAKILGLLFLLPGMALAHTSIGETTGFAHGLSHPLGGADHILAMVAVGLWAAQMGGRAMWAVPGTFVLVMMLGGALGMSGIAIPFIEEGILLSVLVLGVFIAGAFKFPPALSALIVGVFALFHGHAHGTELTTHHFAQVSYSVGFALATAALHTAGIACAMLLQRIKLEQLNRFAGGVIAFSGIYLAVS